MDKFCGCCGAELGNQIASGGGFGQGPDAGWGFGTGGTSASAARVKEPAKEFKEQRADYDKKIALISMLKRATKEQSATPEKKANEIYAKAFNCPRDARSDEYRYGVLSALKIHLGECASRPCPFDLGTPSADAYYAGYAEGVGLYLQHKESE